jgi:hypothetical protein
MKKLTLKEAREKGRLKEFADQHKGAANQKAFEDVLGKIERGKKR